MRIQAYGMNGRVCTLDYILRIPSSGTYVVYYLTDVLRYVVKLAQLQHICNTIEYQHSESLSGTNCTQRRQVYSRRPPAPIII